MKRISVLASIVVYASLSVGCGGGGTGVEGTVPLSGTVTDSGVPLEVEGREMGLGMVVVGFCPLEDENDRERIETATAMVDADGKFEIVDGLEPGLYAVTVKQYDPYPNVDRLRGRFSESKTKIIREVEAATELHIDISEFE